MVCDRVGTLADDLDAVAGTSDDHYFHLVCQPICDVVQSPYPPSVFHAMPRFDSALKVPVPNDDFRRDYVNVAQVQPLDGHHVPIAGLCISNRHRAPSHFPTRRTLSSAVPPNFWKYLDTAHDRGCDCAEAGHDHDPSPGHVLRVYRSHVVQLHDLVLAHALAPTPSHVLVSAEDHPDIQFENNHGVLFRNCARFLCNLLSPEVQLRHDVHTDYRVIVLREQWERHTLFPEIDCDDHDGRYIL